MFLKPLKSKEYPKNERSLLSTSPCSFSGIAKNRCRLRTFSIASHVRHGFVNQQEKRSNRLFKMFFGRVLLLAMREAF
jgi:hypothetical protein